MNIHQAIAALGQTEESISEKLRSMGVKGKKRVANSCPIANYLTACGLKDPYVGTSTASVQELNASGRTYDEEAALPIHITSWIQRFDNGDRDEFLMPPPVER